MFRRRPEVRARAGIFALAALVSSCLASGLAPASESSAAPYDVPIPGWVAEVATELKQQFADGIAAEAAAFVETRTAEDVRALVETADQLAAVGERLDGAMSTIGSIDSSFGIPGVSRLLTAEGAVRDTIFGFVVWHESAIGESREIAAGLERSVDQLIRLGTQARRRARELAATADRTREALEQRDYAGVAEASSAVSGTTAELESIADQAEEAATELEGLVWRIQDSGRSSIVEEWQDVLLAVSETRRLTTKARPILSSVRENAAASDVLTGALEAIVDVLSAMTASETGAFGNVYYPIRVLEGDVEVASMLEDGILSDTTGKYSEETKATLRALLEKIVTADRILAERAVEYTSTQVGRAVDRLEDHYKAVASYDESSSEKRRGDALQKVDLALRRNEDLQDARASVRAARAAFDDGCSKADQGAGFETRALEQFKNAWMHALNAGSSAKKALAAIGSE